MIVEGIEILCPCCKDVVFGHLCSKGFVKGYIEWIYHSEDKILMELDSSSDDQTSYDDIDGLLFEMFKDVAEEGGAHEGLNEDANKFYKLVDDANQELYPGCEKFSSLSFTIRMYLLKSLKYLCQNFTNKKKMSDNDTSVESDDEYTDDSSTC
jgi:hypothetical protein